MSEWCFTDPKVLTICYHLYPPLILPDVVLACMVRSGAEQNDGFGQTLGLQDFTAVVDNHGDLLQVAITGAIVV